MCSRRLSDLLSVCRVPASLALIVLYSPHPGWRFFATVALIFAIVASDIADGQIAKRRGSASHRGYLLDGWGDRAFHLAIYLILFDQQVLSLAVVWLLTFREITVYAVRSFDSTWHATQTRVERTVNWTYTGIVRLILFLELARGAGQLPLSHSTYSFIVPLVLATWSAISYVQLTRRFLSAWRVAAE